MSRVDVAGNRAEVIRLLVPGEEPKLKAGTKPGAEFAFSASMVQLKAATKPPEALGDAKGLSGRLRL